LDSIEDTVAAAPVGPYGVPDGEPVTFGRYGLPEQVAFCRRCVISNQRPSSVKETSNYRESPKPTIKFDREGVCDACRYAEMKNRVIDWEDRDEQLRELLDQYRSRNGTYDCLVPGSGGKDSIYAAHLLKYRYGMHPLTVTWAPHVYTEVGWRNHQHWIQSGFDNYLFTPNGKVHRTLTRLAVLNLLHPFQPFIIGQKNFAPNMAVKFGIPLVIYGENEAEYGNPIAANSQARRERSMYSSHGGEPLYFGGVQMDDLSEYGIERRDIAPYLPAAADALERVGVDVRYLGYYIKWIPQDAYYYAVENAGFEANPDGRTEGTYSKYNSLDDRIDGFHYYTTFIKFGIGRATYDAAQEIRSGHLTREEGVALVRRYDGEFPNKYFGEILEYLDLTETEFWQTVDSFRPEHLWDRVGDKWAIRHQVS
jgi:N-acetyl sugar amidotransferase